ncbi:M50 family metallopeptidase [Alloiococcus sp. CFN-8]|uniref:M50 family metallopeptidase n=1 Tax=Alloiococcus sp. CFN-8 TaxID=3416081 RepID=UPI003CF0ED78
MLTFLLIALGLQHIIHEFSHVLAAKLLGEKVIKIQWLTYKGGTRVFYENEPDLTDEVEKKWAVIAGAGYIITNSLGYIFAIVFTLFDNSFIKVFLCIVSMVFLVIDSLYFTLGSTFDFGDVIGVRRVLNISKTLAIISSSLILVINIFIIGVVFYNI